MDTLRKMPKGAKPCHECSYPRGCADLGYCSREERSSRGTLRKMPKGAKPVDTFSEREISLTLTGAEWFAFLSRAIGRELSLEGARLCNGAAGKLQHQLLEHSDGSYGARKARERVIGADMNSDGAKRRNVP